jgi:hypothetical protein
MQTYIIAPTGADIIHYGKGHDDNPPGRGSGRYAWGSSNNARMTRKAKKNIKNSYSTIRKNYKKIKKSKNEEEYEQIKTILDQEMENIKEADLKYGTEAVDKVINNAVLFNKRLNMSTIGIEYRWLDYQKTDKPILKNINKNRKEYIK